MTPLARFTEELGRLGARRATGKLWMAFEVVAGDEGIQLASSAGVTSDANAERDAEVLDRFGLDDLVSKNRFSGTYSFSDASAVRAALILCGLEFVKGRRDGVGTARSRPRQDEADDKGARGDVDRRSSVLRTSRDLAKPPTSSGRDFTSPEFRPAPVSRRSLEEEEREVVVLMSLEDIRVGDVPVGGSQRSSTDAGELIRKAVRWRVLGERESRLDLAKLDKYTTPDPAGTSVVSIRFSGRVADFSSRYQPSLANSVSLVGGAMEVRRWYIEDTSILDEILGDRS